MEQHCMKKFAERSGKLNLQIDKADAYLNTTINNFKRLQKESKNANICLEATSV